MISKEFRPLSPKSLNHKPAVQSKLTENWSNVSDNVFPKIGQSITHNAINNFNYIPETVITS